MVGGGGGRVGVTGTGERGWVPSLASQRIGLRGV